MKCWNGICTKYILTTFVIYDAIQILQANVTLVLAINISQMYVVFKIKYRAIK